MKKSLLFVSTLSLATLLLTEPALAEDIFAAGKTAIKESAGNLYIALIMIGFAISAYVGCTTQNWFAAIATFAFGILFMSVAGPIIGL